MRIRNKVIWLSCAALLTCAGCTTPKSQLQTIKDRGVLRVVTRNGPTTYYTDRDGPTGFEYQMVKRFAEQLGVKLQIQVARTIPEVIADVASGEADIAAAGLTRNQVKHSPLRAGPSYFWITQQLVYRSGRAPPRTLDDVFPNQVHLAQGAIPEAVLHKLRAENPTLSWSIDKNVDGAGLLDMLERGDIAYTIVPSNVLAHARQIRPELRAALAVTAPQPLVWGFKKSDDLSLATAVDHFNDRITRDGVLTKLVDRFYAPAESFNYVDSRSFIRSVDRKLPHYKPLFKTAAHKFKLDWRLLAAVSYEESHWNARAESPTGVRGLMMLTHDTAERFGVKNRVDPRQSLTGGAKYLAQLRRDIPKRIQEPDRTWLALAAYNIGFGHLEDARILTQEQKGDPDSWADVRERLPLLNQRRWYKHTRNGYARGYEAVKYVRHIRKYYTALVQLSQPENNPPVPEVMANASSSTDSQAR